MDILPSSCREYSRHTWTFCLVPTESIPGIHGHSSDFRYFTQRIFPKWQLSKGIFPSGNFPNVQFPKSVLAAALGPQPALAAALDPLAHLSRSAPPPLQSQAPQRAWTNLWEVAVWEISNLESCHLENCHLGSRPWENAFGKVPNTILPSTFRQFPGIHGYPSKHQQTVFQVHMDILPSTCRQYSRYTWIFFLAPTDSIPGTHGYPS